MLLPSSGWGIPSLILGPWDAFFLLSLYGIVNKLCLIGLYETSTQPSPDGIIREMRGVFHDVCDAMAEEICFRQTS